MIRKNKKILMILVLASGLLLGGCSSSSWVGNASTWWDGTTFVGAGVNRAIDKNRHKRKSLIGRILDGDDIFSIPNDEIEISEMNGEEVRQELKEIGQLAEDGENIWIIEDPEIRQDAAIRLGQGLDRLKELE